MSLSLVCNMAEKYFHKISPDKSNAQVMRDTLGIEELRKQVVSRLEIIEKEWSGSWWEDKKLMGAFDQSFVTGKILLPLDVVERVRWIALVCIGISENEEFSYGNILLSVDYLPDEEIPDLEDDYGASVVEEIQKFHKEIAEHGWKSLLK